MEPFFPAITLSPPSLSRPQEGTRAELSSVNDKYLTARAELDLMQLQLSGAPSLAVAHEGARSQGEDDSVQHDPQQQRGNASNELLRTYLGRIHELEKEVWSEGRA